MRTRAPEGSSLWFVGLTTQRSTLPVRTPTKVSAMAMARATAEAMNAAAMWGDF
ncbi:hypothetical protein ABH903_001578 [Brevibacterium epidermidis]|uniref:Uncharacterized protein n=1 Tax=Brevibacterium epidermidis TaxID=1698 RepID=A0ABV4EJ76_BREEP